MDTTTRELITELEENPTWQYAYVVGGPDSGKTTFCQYLFGRVKSQFLTAYIDCDPGQSVIGPPTTVGLNLYPKNRDNKKFTCLRFVGSTSPIGNMLQTLSGIKRLTEKAVEMGAQKIVIDSSGFVFGSPGQEFQFQVIDLLQPDYIVSIQQGNALESLLKNFSPHKKIKIRRLHVSQEINRRSFADRQNYRSIKLQKYFQEAILKKLNFRTLGLHGMIPGPQKAEISKNLLIALCDQENYVVKLGIIHTINFRETFLTFYAPPFDSQKVASIQFGSMYLDKTGKEL
jgi:polynucleotide 5'-hydroxyl-kinase GRC3/NOL9